MKHVNHQLCLRLGKCAYCVIHFVLPFAGMFPVTALMTGVVVQKYKINSENGTAAIDSGDQLYNEQSSTGVAITLTFLTGLIQVRHRCEETSLLFGCEVDSTMWLPVYSKKLQPLFML